MVMIIRRFQVNWIIQIEGAWTFSFNKSSLKTLSSRLFESSLKTLQKLSECRKSESSLDIIRKQALQKLSC